MTPFNFATMSEYSGRNLALLSAHDYPAYATFHQVRQLGGKIKKGAKGVHIFCGFRDKEDKDSGKTVSVPTGAVVFHIADCEQLDPAYLELLKDQKPKPSEQSIKEDLVAAIFG